jgi:signal transduction histidine kinase
MILDDLGLLPAVEFLRQGIARRAGLAIFVAGSLGERMCPGIERTLYRAIHEALAGAHRARARQVWIRFSQNAVGVSCTVRDDGEGFGSLPEAIGREMPGIRHRVEDLAGTLTIHSRRGQGTSVVVALPLA